MPHYPLFEYTVMRKHYIDTTYEDALARVTAYYDPVSDLFILQVMDQTPGEKDDIIFLNAFNLVKTPLFVESEESIESALNSLGINVPESLIFALIEDEAAGIVSDETFEHSFYNEMVLVKKEMFGSV